MYNIDGGSHDNGSYLSSWESPVLFDYICITLEIMKYMVK